MTYPQISPEAGERIAASDTAPEMVPEGTDWPQGWRRFLYATNHKDVGTMFLAFALFCGVTGLVFALFLRAELMHPGLQIFHDLRAYHVALTGHGVFALIFAAVPAVIGLGAWLVPLTIGAPGLAFPRMSNLSFWLMPFALILCVMSFLVPGHGQEPGVASGWYLGTPMSSYGEMGPAVDFMIMAQLMWMAAVLLAAVNFLTTIFNMRAPGLRLSRLPLLPWAMMAFSLLMLVALPALFAARYLLLADRHFGTTLFNAAGGGDPVMYQNLFWLFGHAIGLACLLPGLGMIGHVLSAFSGRPLSGRISIAYAIFATGGLGLFGWGMHIGSIDVAGHMEALSLIAGLSVFLPAGVIMSGFLSTLWGGAIRFRAPMLWALGFLPVFVIGILSGLMLTCIGSRSVLHGTSFEIAYGHYFISLSVIFSFFTGWYFWFPKMSGVLYDERLAKLHFWLTTIGGHLTFLPMFFLGMAGMPRGAADYPKVFAGWNGVVSVGAMLLGLSMVVFLLTMGLAFRNRRPAENNPWQITDCGLEWSLSSPPPYRTFDELPHMR